MKRLLEIRERLKNAQTRHSDAVEWGKFYAQAPTDLADLCQALEIAIQTLEYCLGPTRDVKTGLIKSTLEKIEAILGKST